MQWDFNTCICQGCKLKGIDTGAINSNFVVIIGNMVAGLYIRKNYQPGQQIKIEGHEAVIEKMGTLNFTLKMGERSIVMPVKKLLEADVEILG